MCPQNGFECQRSIGQGSGMGFFVHFGEGALECADPMTGPLIDVAGAQCLDGWSNLVWGVLRPPWRGGDTDRLTAIDCQPLAFCYRSVHSRLRCHSRCSEGRAGDRVQPCALTMDPNLTLLPILAPASGIIHDGVDFWEGVPSFNGVVAALRAASRRRCSVGVGLAGPPRTRTGVSSACSLSAGDATSAHKTITHDAAHNRSESIVDAS